MITYSSQKAINQPHNDTLEYQNMARICDMLKIHVKSLNYRYVDGTPTPAKIQISHFLMVGQFHIYVYKISVILSDAR